MTNVNKIAIHFRMKGSHCRKKANAAKGLVQRDYQIEARTWDHAAEVLLLLNGLPSKVALMEEEVSCVS